MHPLQLEVGKTLVLSWSVKVLAVGSAERFSDVTPVTLGKDPIAHLIRPDDLAAKSFPLPTMALGLRPETSVLASGPFSKGEAIHVTSVQSLLG